MDNSQADIKNEVKVDMTTPKTTPNSWIRFEDQDNCTSDPEGFVSIPFGSPEAEQPPRSEQPPDITSDMTIPTENEDQQKGTETRTKQFSNGQIIVSIFPVNESCSWVTPAKFKPHLVPEELMADSLTLTVEDYVSFIRMLVNDFRFNCYLIFYKRVIAIWATLSVCVLLMILFSGLNRLALFISSMSWLLSNFFGVFIVIFLKRRLVLGLEKCIALINDNFSKHNILIGIDDLGNYSRHKINIIFVFFEPKDCIESLKNTINNTSIIVESVSNESNVNVTSAYLTWKNTMHTIDSPDIIITGLNRTTIPQKEKYSHRLFLRYSQRWVKHLAQKARFELQHPQNVPAGNVPGNNITGLNKQTSSSNHLTNGDISIYLDSPPRHCQTSKCPCQFIEEHLRYKPPSLNCFI